MSKKTEGNLIHLVFWNLQFELQKDSQRNNTEIKKELRTLF